MGGAAVSLFGGGAGGGAMSVGVSTGCNSAGTTGTVSNQVIFCGGSNITLSESINGQSATITVIGGAGTGAGGSFSAGASSLGNTDGTTGTVSGQIIFVGGSNITLSESTNGLSATITIIGGAGTGAGGSFSAGASNLGNTLGTTGTVSGQIIFVGGNNVTLSESVNVGSATITISVPNQSVQTGSIINDVIISGNTSGTTADISSGTMVLAGGNFITLFQNANSITISAMPMLNAGVSNLGNTLGTTGSVDGQLVLVGGNEITLSQSINLGSATITISAPDMLSAGISNLGNTLGTSGAVSDLLVLVGGNNITLSQSADAFGGSGTVTISAANQTIQTQSIIRDVVISGNTSGTTADISSGTLTLAGGQSITLSQVGNAITISGASTSQSLQTQSIIRDIVISGNTSGVTADITSGTLNLAGGANITLSQAGNAITISGGTAAGASFSAGVSSLGNTAGTTGVVTDLLVFAGGSNITVSQSINGGSATITINAATVAGGSFSAGVSNLGNTLGSTGTVSQQLVLAGGNNITLSQSTDGNSATVTISAFNQTVQTSGLFDLTLSGNTSGTLALVSSGTLTLAGGNQIVLSQVGNAITISASQSVQTQSIIRDINIIGNTTGTTADISSGTFFLAGGNGIILSQDGQSVTISGHELTAGISTFGNTSGTTGLVHDRLIFVGGNNITLSQSVNLQSATLTFSSPNMFSAGVSTGGNTLGTTGVVSGLVVLVGGNNVTLSQSTNGVSATVTISVPSQTLQTQSIVRDIVISGNTSGTTADITSGTLTLAGGQSITLSQVGNAITISGASQSVQTQSTHVHIISGNTSGTTASMSTGTIVLLGGNNITLSQNANSVTISGLDFPIASISAASTLTTANDTILVDASAGAVTVTLPAASTVTKKTYTIKKIDSSTNIVTINPNGTDKIDNGSSITLVAQFESRTFKSDGTNWWIV